MMQHQLAYSTLCTNLEDDIWFTLINQLPDC